MAYHTLYRRYAISNFTVSLLGSLQYTLATDTMLQATGALAGSDTAVVSAGVNFIGKDLLGQTASLWFMHRIGKYSDRNPTTFFHGMIGLQQLALGVETLTFMTTTSVGFLGLAGTANVAKNIAFCGTGAINARVVSEIIKSDSRDTGEVYSHITTISSFGSSVGMALGVAGIYICPDPGLRAGIMPVLGLLKYMIMRHGLKGLYL